MTSIWPVLVVAALGVVGTLGAAISTQVLTTRRDARRWQEQRQDEERRWERERKDRLELWRREDELRHLEARKDVYIDFMKALWSWGRLAAVVRSGIEAGAKSDLKKNHGELTDRGVQVVELLAILELAASPDVREPARRSCELISSFSLALLSVPVPKQEILQIHDTYKAMARKTLEAMRADRGLPMGEIVELRPRQ